MKALLRALCVGVLALASIGSAKHIWAADEFAPKQDSLPVPAPKNAVVLFDGAGKNLFLGPDGKPTNWKVESGELIGVTQSHHNHAMSKLLFRDADIHVEFNIDLKEDGNSGVYLHGEYEMQIFNSFGKKDPDFLDEGAMYRFQKPLVNASRKVGEWQVYDIRFHSPRRGADGKIAEEGEVTAWLNGQKVQDNYKFGEPRSNYRPFKYKVTPYLKKLADELKRTDMGPVFLQDHGSPCHFRNIWVVPLDDHTRMIGDK